MVAQMIYWLINMSIIGTVFGVLLYPFRYVKKLPRRFIAGLWLIPFIRLVCPVGIRARFSLLSILSDLLAQWNITLVKSVPAGKGKDSMLLSNVIQAAESYEPFTWKSERSAVLFTVVGAIWLTVAAVLLAAAVRNYRKTGKELKEGVLCGPAVYGLFRPKLYLPDGTADELIVEHEKMHLKRHDTLWRTLALITACVHWFNPAVWFFCRTFFEDTESACDESVLACIGGEEKIKYAKLLLETQTNRPWRSAAGFAGGRTGRRVADVLSFKKVTWLSAAGCAALAAAFVYLMLTNA